MTNTLQITRFTGLPVITGSVEDLTAAIAAGTVTIGGQAVTIVGEMDEMDDGVYGVQIAGALTPSPRRTHAGPIRRHGKRRHQCVTGGNCSSHGDGRNCGGYGCDGYES